MHQFLLSGLLGTLMVSGLFIGCRSDSEPPAPSPAPSASLVAFPQAFSIMASSCMPCHNRATLPQIIRQAKAASFAEIEGETRHRIVAALEGLLEDMQEGVALSFTSEDEIERFLRQSPGEMYLFLEKGMMPPPWGHPLLAKLKWNHTPLTLEKRIVLLQYARQQARGN